ncbi:MAG: hypothetical protein K2K56_10600 [Lachnospiraceae bacterium]|nr:hypothetical protein [Lachnospiraceae bacterium]
MKEMIETMQKSYIKRLARMITAKGNPCNEDLEDVLDKLDVLALDITRYDEKMLVLPLEIKRMVAFIVSPSHYMTYNTKREGDYLTVTASLFWSPDDLLPAGVGFVKSNINMFGSYDWTTTQEAKECQFEAALRGSAASRAYYDAGIGLGFGDELPDPEVVEKKQSNSDMGKIPDPQAAKNGRKPGRKAKVSPEKVENNPTANQKDESENSLDIANSGGKAAEDTAVTKEDANTQVVKPENTPLEHSPTTDSVSSYSLEEALKATADIGAYKGYTLQEILENKPKGLIWLINKNSAVKEQALTVIKSDPDLYKLFSENSNNM